MCSAPSLLAALGKLEARYPRLSKTVDLRYFGGLKLAEISEIQGLSISAIKKDLQLAKAILHGELKR